MCVSGSGMGIGGPGLQWFIIVPCWESGWSHLLLPLQPFSVPELEMFATLSRQRESTLPRYYPLQALSLLFIPCQPQAWVCTKASTKNPMMMAIYMLHSSAQQLGAVLNFPHGFTLLTPGQLQPPDSKERDVLHCALNIPNCALSTHPVSKYSTSSDNHLGETFILNQIPKCKRWLKYPRVKMQTEKVCDILIVLCYAYRRVIGQDVIIFTDNYLQTFLYTFTNFKGH